MILGTVDLMIVIHFDKTYYKTPKAKSKAENCLGHFTVTIISEQGTRSESSVGLPLPLVLV